MNKNIIRSGLAVPLFFMCLFSISGALVAPRSVAELEKGSDLIVHATSARIVQNGTRFDFSLKINRVIKGDPNLADSSIGGYWISTNQTAVGGSIPGGSGIWFLERTEGAWRVLPLVQGTMQLSDIYIPAPVNPLPDVYAYAADNSVEDKLASEVCAAFENSVGSGLWSYAALSGGIDELKSTVLQVFYRRFASAVSPEQKAVGLSGLIRTGDATALSVAASIASAIEGRSASGILQLSIREYFRPKDSASVIALGRVATDSSLPPDFREVASHALGAIHTRDALPFLAALLDDPELSLRIEAVGGMGAFANGLPVQTRAMVATLAYLQLSPDAPYRTAETESHFALGRQAISANETSYISFWKAWWSKNRASLSY